MFCCRLLFAVVLVGLCQTAAAGQGEGPQAAAAARVMPLPARSPLTDPAEMQRRFRLDPRRWPGPPDKSHSQMWEYDIADARVSVSLPGNYRSTVPHGLLVWMGVGGFSPAWLPPLARHKLICVGVEMKTARGHVASGLWVDAVEYLKAQYGVDASRVYACGFSAGGHCARRMVMAYPDVFRGCLCMMGDEFYAANTRREVTVESVGCDWQGPLETIKRDTRLVILRGETDQMFPPEYGRRQYEALLLDGFQRVAFLAAARTGHQPPGRAWFEKALALLCEPPVQKPPTTAPTAGPRPESGQIAHAERLLATARYWQESAYPGNPGPRETRRCLRRVIEEYPTTPGAAGARALMKQLEAPLAETRRVQAAAAAGTPPTGPLRLAFTEQSTLSDPVMVRRQGGKDLQRLIQPGAELEEYTLADEVFEIVVPPEYVPDAPPGLLVWMGTGEFPGAWLDAVRRQKLILIAPRNLRASLAQHQLPLDGVHNVSRLYKTDGHRVYTAGLGFGHKVAASLVSAYPGVFRACVSVPGQERKPGEAAEFEQALQAGDGPAGGAAGPGAAKPH